MFSLWVKKNTIQNKNCVFFIKLKGYSLKNHYYYLHRIVGITGQSQPARFNIFMVLGWFELTHCSNLNENFSFSLNCSWILTLKLVLGR